MKARSHYRAGDVARLLGVSQRTVWNWFERGVLPGYRLPLGSRQYRVPHGELMRYLRANAPRCTPEALRLIEAEDVDVEDLVARYRDLEGRVEALRAERDALQAFKAYVHGRLDRSGVPADPDPEKTAATGCRIGGRLDYLKAERDALRAALRGLLPLCGCDGGQRARHCYDAASGQMELEGFERCARCARARDLLAGSEGGL
jgi:excisionase family DNA binding protein